MGAHGVMYTGGEGSPEPPVSAQRAIVSKRAEERQRQTVDNFPGVIKVANDDGTYDVAALGNYDPTGAPVLYQKVLPRYPDMVMAVGDSVTLGKVHGKGRVFILSTRSNPVTKTSPFRAPGNVAMLDWFTQRGSIDGTNSSRIDDLPAGFFSLGPNVGASEGKKYGFDQSWGPDAEFDTSKAMLLAFENTVIMSEAQHDAYFVCANTDPRDGGKYVLVTGATETGSATETLYIPVWVEPTGGGIFLGGITTVVTGTVKWHSITSVQTLNHPGGALSPLVGYLSLKAGFTYIGTMYPGSDSVSVSWTASYQPCTTCVDVATQAVLWRAPSISHPQIDKDSRALYGFLSSGDVCAIDLGDQKAATPRLGGSAMWNMPAVPAGTPSTYTDQGTWYSSPVTHPTAGTYSFASLLATPNVVVVAGYRPVASTDPPVWTMSHYWAPPYTVDPPFGGTGAAVLIANGLPSTVWFARGYRATDGALLWTREFNERSFQIDMFLAGDAVCILCNMINQHDLIHRFPLLETQEFGNPGNGVSVMGLNLADGSTAYQNDLFIGSGYKVIRGGTSRLTAGSPPVEYVPWVDSEYIPMATFWDGSNPPIAASPDGRASNWIMATVNLVEQVAKQQYSTQTYAPGGWAYYIYYIGMTMTTVSTSHRLWIDPTTGSVMSDTLRRRQIATVARAAGDVLAPAVVQVDIDNQWTTLAASPVSGPSGLQWVIQRKYLPNTLVGSSFVPSPIFVLRTAGFVGEAQTYAQTENIPPTTGIGMSAVCAAIQSGGQIVGSIAHVLIQPLDKNALPLPTRVYAIENGVMDFQGQPENAVLASTTLYPNYGGGPGFTDPLHPVGLYTNADPVEFTVFSDLNFPAPPFYVDVVASGPGADPIETLLVTACVHETVEPEGDPTFDWSGWGNIHWTASRAQNGTKNVKHDGYPGIQYKDTVSTSVNVGVQPMTGDGGLYYATLATPPRVRRIVSVPG